MAYLTYPVQHPVRMDAALIERLRVEAKRSDHSVNKEIVFRLRQSIAAQDAATTTQETA